MPWMDQDGEAGATDDVVGDALGKTSLTVG